MSKLAYSIAQARHILSDLGWRLLSDKYINNNLPLELQCLACGICITKSLRSRFGSGCKECYQTQRRIVVDKIQSKLIERGESLVSAENYKNNQSALIVSCPISHIYTTNWSKIDDDKGCPVCFDNDRGRLGIDYIKNEAEKRGDRLLSDTYTNANMTLILECSKKHIYTKPCGGYIYASERSCCPVCNKKRNYFEEAVFSYVLSKYPFALRNVKGVLTNKRFELDIWMPNLKLAIECDGDNWHSKPENVERDARKNADCNKNGIRLLRLAYSLFKNNKTEALSSIDTFIEQ